MISGTVVFAAIVTTLVYFIVRPLPVSPTPAHFDCYDLSQGAYVPIEKPRQVFGIGLSYAAHIEETASSFDPDRAPPVFEKLPSSVVRTDAEVPMPSRDALIEAADAFEPGLGATLHAEFPNLSALLDYEVELGFVVLDDIDPSQLDDSNFAPRLGFFIANDVSARSIAILGEGRPNRVAYWGVSKSFPGFTPIGSRAWVPLTATPNGIPCLEIETLVNGEVRQRQTTNDLIYTPREMLAFVHEAFPNTALSRGTIVLTGTPGGVAMVTPRWLVRTSNLLRLSRFRKLAAKLDGDTERFLKAGDRVTVRGQGIGRVNVTIVSPPTEPPVH